MAATGETALKADGRIRVQPENTLGWPRIRCVVADFIPEADENDFMYGRSFQDPDGHLWEVLYMDMSAMPQ